MTNKQRNCHIEKVQQSYVYRNNRSLIARRIFLSNHKLLRDFFLLKTQEKNLNM